MAKKMTFFTEMAYLFGIAILALGTAFMERADYGLSMVVAPAYLVYLKVSQSFSWFTFGMAEYCFQALLLVVLSLVVRRFHKMYLFSFVTAVVYGIALDIAMSLVALVPKLGNIEGPLFFVVGMILGAMGVSMIFHTYIAPEAYELFVKEVASKYELNIHKTKTVYDCSSCIIAIAMSFVFFGFGVFEGVKFGTIITAAINGWLISRFTKIYESVFEFKDGRNWRRYFE